MEKKDAPSASILIVDDTPANLRLLALMLNSQGYRVRIAEDGPRALESVRAHPPDLILLDVMMPGMNGFEVCQYLRADQATRTIPIIFISALDDAQDKINAFKAGGVDYVTKPFHVEEVLARVGTHLARRDLERQLQSALSELAQAKDELERRAAVPAADPQAQSAAALRFVPRQLLELLGKPNVVEVQLGNHAQKGMTVLYAGLQAFAERATGMTPEARIKFLNAFLARVTPLIRRHQGVVVTYPGDGILAVFPGPADDALQAALEMQRAVRDHNRELVGEGLTPLKVGIGLHTGTLTLGIVGDAEHMQGTVISGAVRAAVLLEEWCKVYGANILASGETLANVMDPTRFQSRHVEPIPATSDDAPVAVYEVVERETGLA